MLKNANLVLSDREVKHASVLIAAGKIVSFEGEKADEELDLTGTTLIPGFIDVHIHGAVGVDVMDAGPADLRKMSEYLATQGVTGWLATLVPGSDENYASVSAAVGKSMND
ncbi:MAG TPA: hypothetical protein VFT48_11295, partial [Pyrinomonadaceae bacterium]|nr:hypothetical protein [Pyrinomonadaceae bacterium]